MNATEKHGPSARDVKLFPLVFLALFALIALLAWKRPGGLLVGAAILTGAWVVALLLDAKHRRRNALGFVLPALLGLTGGLAAVTDLPVAMGALGIGVLGAVFFAASLGAAASVFRGWMQAAEPIGWSISHFILAIIWFLIVTPIGLVARLLGHDPLERTVDPGASTYWVEHRPGKNVARYLKQY